MKLQLCLGTAQFGLAYGITNAAGQTPETAVAQLLVEADGAGIRWLDTAQAYGNAETVLGHQLPKSHGFQLISKLPAQPQLVFSPRDSEAWDQALATSCQRLGVKALDALLLHSPADLSKPGGEHLKAWLLAMRESGRVRRLGVSIYAAEDLKGVCPALLDLVQLPLSLFDQRLLQNGTIAWLKARGSAIHARSLYLQGLLLTPAVKWPSWVSSEVRSHQQALENLAEHKGCRLIDLALGFAREQTDLEAVVLGVCNLEEMFALREAWAANSPWKAGEWRDWALQDPVTLDPRRWPKTA